MPYNTFQFITDNPRSALEQIHGQLGPEAVVLSVRPLPEHGVARLWHWKRRIEILAGVPEKSSPAERRKLSLVDAEDASPGRPADGSRRWQTIAWLETMGLLPAHAARLQHYLQALHPSAPGSTDAEWQAVRAALAEFWLPPRPLKEGRAAQTHVFIGPPGTGKTTVLCKWLTLAVLTEGRSACVWRLDGASANTAELLTVHCEMLGVPLERFWSAPETRADLHLVDLPGVAGDDPRALTDLRDRLSILPAPELHLVLNSAYQTEVLLAQCHAFAGLEPADLILTHLDEETRRVKLWNLVLGTNFTIRFLSAGQKIPGEFHSAAPDLLFPSEIGR